MNVSVVNKKLTVDHIKIKNIGGSSFVLLGDAGIITSSSCNDTPADSVITTTRISLVEPIY